MSLIAVWRALIGLLVMRPKQNTTFASGKIYLPRTFHRHWILNCWKAIGLKPTTISVALLMLMSGCSLLSTIIRVTGLAPTVTPGGVGSCTIIRLCPAILSPNSYMLILQ